MCKSRVIFISAADVSGDRHAAGLIQSLYHQLDDVRFIGIGGKCMERAGCELLDRPVDQASMTTGVFEHLGYFRRLIRKAKRAIKQIRPNVHVPVNSPAINWHLARTAKRSSIPVVYYIAPQTWAWAPWRVRKLRKYTDAVACILPFEQDYFRTRAVNATYVGHPLFDELPAAKPPDLASAYQTGQWEIVLLPGSRESEIKNHAPGLVRVMELLSERYPSANFTITAIDEASADIIQQSAGREDLPISTEDINSILSRSHFAIVASGTVTLQVAHFGLPMVIFYRVWKWGYRLIGRWLIRTKYLSLVNILAGEQLVPELMPWFGNVDELVRHADTMLKNLNHLQTVQKKLQDLISPLHAPVGTTAAENAARLVIEVLQKRA